MAIVKMKKLCAIVPSASVHCVLEKLHCLGCVELEGTDERTLEQHEGALLIAIEDTGAAYNATVLVSALNILEKYIPKKASFLSARTPVSEKDAFCEESLLTAVTASKRLGELSKKIDANKASQNRIQQKLSVLEMWKELNVDLDFPGTKSSYFTIGVIPSNVDINALSDELYKKTDTGWLNVVSADKEQSYVTLMVHRDDAEAALDFLKPKGFMISSLNELHDTASENTWSLLASIEHHNERLSDHLKEIDALSVHRNIIEIAVDAYSQRKVDDVILSQAGRTQKTTVLTGWLPIKAEKRVGEFFRDYHCAWEIIEPNESDNPPTALESNAFSNAFSSVTDMYGTPPYNSIIDPNPFVSFFYFLFFGFIIADVVYGGLIFLACLVFLKKKKPVGESRKLVSVFMYCGIAGMIAGVITGGYLSDAVFALTSFFGKPISIPPLWFNPIEEPTKLFNLSLMIGAVQICIGLGLSAYRQIRQGNPLDAFCDVGLWYILFAGIGIFMLNGSDVGMYIAGAGVLGILLLGGRHKKGLGKLTGGLGQLYGITGFLSDLFSYARIMALCLAGSVIGQVVNQIATMGSGVIGFILFVLVFFVGHIFNLALSILGAYVHAGRLQYLEFFGRFFEDGGRPFAPLWNNTKYVEIIKEEI